MTRISRRRATALFTAAPAAGLALLAGPARAANHQVKISGNAFHPAKLTIKAGDTVTWINQDGRDHTATAKDKSWSTKSLPGGGQGSITFADKGAQRYACKWHPSMKGTITVT